MKTEPFALNIRICPDVSAAATRWSKRWPWVKMFVPNTEKQSLPIKTRLGVFENLDRGFTGSSHCGVIFRFSPALFEVQ
jgi:hypothetical protein